jgi:hypothetical protein
MLHGLRRVLLPTMPRPGASLVQRIQWQVRLEREGPSSFTVSFMTASFGKVICQTTSGLVDPGLGIEWIFT